MRLNRPVRSQWLGCIALPIFSSPQRLLPLGDEALPCSTTSPHLGIEGEGQSDLQDREKFQVHAQQ